MTLAGQRAICLAARLAGDYLYVASSNTVPGSSIVGTDHHVTAFAIDPATGALKKHGEAMRLPIRPIHLSTDDPVAKHPGGVQ